MTSILIVDDEAQIVHAVERNLVARGYEVTSARDGEVALATLRSRPFDLVILDLGLPKIAGLDVLSELRTWSTTPVIVVSARSGDPDKIQALDLGADDYLTKPFSIGELLARVRAALRRRGQNDAITVIATADFVLDFSRLLATKDGIEVHLTPSEWKIVTVLARSEGRLVSHHELAQVVWGDGGDEANPLRVHLTHLRRKLEPEPARPRYFRTEPGLGYRFHVNP